MNNPTAAPAGYGQKVVYDHSGGLQKPTINECFACDDKRNNVVASQFSATSLSAFSQFENHVPGGGLSARTFRLVCTQADRRKHRLDEVGRANMNPLCGRKFIEGQSSIFVFFKAYYSFAILIFMQSYEFFKSAHRGIVAHRAQHSSRVPKRSVLRCNTVCNAVRV